MATAAKEASGITTRLITAYVRHHAGDEGVTRLIELSAVVATEAELADPRRWWSYADTIALFEGAAVLFADDEVANAIGRWALTENVLPALIPLLRVFGGPSQLLRNIARTSKKFSTAGVMEAVDIGRTQAVVSYRLLAPHVPSAHDCGYTAGLLTQVAPIFGLPDAAVTHRDCQVAGAERCTYLVSWQRTPRLRSRRSLRREQLALDAASAIEEAQRREETVAALLRLSRSLADVTTVRETAQRLADAVPEVVGSRRSTVLLWDEPEGCYRTETVSGMPAHLADAALDFRIDGAGLAQPGMPAIDRPTLVARRHATGALATLLDRFEVDHLAFVPLRSRHKTLGLLIASWGRSGDLRRPRHELEELLHGLADQGATALENAQLLEAVHRRALHDSLTGLPNQARFADLADHELARARRSGTQLVVGVLDVDRFKTVNDTLGHACGDDLLVEVGRRLRTVLREVDTVARVGGDEFSLLLPGDDASAAAERVGRQVLAAFEKPFEIGGGALVMSASIGFAFHPAHGDDLDDLVKRADSAMYDAKAAGRNTWSVYRSSAETVAYDLTALQDDLAHAVARDQLVVAYQPVVQVADGTIVGAEALVRWSHPELGLLSPDAFIPLAEELGLICDIDDWVLRRSCFDLGRALLRHPGPMSVSVNVAGRSLAHPDFTRRLAQAVAGGGIRPDQLVLDVTEALTGGHSTDVTPVLVEVRSAGVRVAIDDFGAISSTLARLDQLPMDQLKLDGCLLEGIVAADHDAPVASAIIAMAHDLGVEVLAEGVEAVDQHAFLVRSGCELAQGFLFAAPVVASLDDVLRSSTTPVGVEAVRC